MLLPGGVDPGVPPLAVLAGSDAAVDPRLGFGDRPGVVLTAHAGVPLFCAVMGGAAGLACQSSQAACAEG